MAKQSRIKRLTRGVVLSPEETAPVIKKLVRFHIGTRVKVRILKDLIKEKDIKCDTGTIIDLKLYRGLTPSKARISYIIELDDNYVKKCHWFHRHGTKINYDEGYGIDKKTQSIERI